MARRTRGTFTYFARSVPLYSREGDVGLALANYSDSRLDILDITVAPSCGYANLVMPEFTNATWTFGRWSASDVTSPARPQSFAGTSGFVIDPLDSAAPTITGVRVEQRPSIRRGATPGAIRTVSFQSPYQVQSSPSNPFNNVTGSDGALSAGLLLRGSTDSAATPVLVRSGESLVLQPAALGKIATVNVEILFTRGAYTYLATARGVQPEVCESADTSQTVVTQDVPEALFAISVDSGDPVTIVRVSVFTDNPASANSSANYPHPKMRLLIADGITDSIPYEDLPGGGNFASRGMRRGGMQDVSATVQAHDSAYSLPAGVFALRGAGRPLHRSQYGASTTGEVSSGFSYGSLMAVLDSRPHGFLVPQGTTTNGFNGLVPPSVWRAFARRWRSGAHKLAPGKVLCVSGAAVTLFAATVAPSALPASVVAGLGAVPIAGRVVDVGITFAVSEETAFPRPVRTVNTRGVVRGSR